MPNVVQRTFGGGELSPSLYARTDLVKYATGLRTCLNFLVERHGRVANRPGFVYVAAAKNAALAARLLPFVFNDDQTYVLELGDRYLRFFQDGAPIVTSGVSAWVTATAYALADLVTRGGVTYSCTLAHTSGGTTEPGVGASWQSNWYAQTGTIYEIPTPYAVADIPRVQYVQSADVITLVHPSYAPRELSRLGHTRWTLSQIVFGPVVSAPTGLAVSAGVAGPVLWYWAVTAVAEDNGEEGLAATVSATTHVPDAATPTLVEWNPVAGAISYNVYRSTDGVTYGFIASAGGTPTPVSDTTFTTSSSGILTLTQDEYVSATDQVRNPTVAAAANKAYDGIYTLAGSITVLAGGGASSTLGRAALYYSRDGEPRILAGYSDDLLVLGDGAASVALANAIVTVPDNGYTTLTIDAVAEIRGSGAAGADFTCSLSATAVTWTKSSVSYSDVDIVPDYASGPPTQAALFNATDSYPSAVGYSQQRQLFGNTNAAPEKVWASRSGSFESFTTSTPILDDDAIRFSLAGRQVQAVKHVLDVDGPILFTQGGVWSLRGDQAGILLPSAINPRQVSYQGASDLPPIVIGNTVLYQQAKGTIVRDLFADANQGIASSDLTIFASHLVDGYTISDWAFAQNPHSIVWIVRSDGVLLGLTYLREHAVIGWHRHETDGVIENVCVVPEGEDDRVYILVRRTINGATVRYIEHLSSRAITETTDVRDLIFMDSALSYDGRNTGAVTMTLSGGSSWDEGETLICTRSVAGFAASNVNDRVDLTAADGTAIRCTIEEYTSTTVVQVRANRDVPSDLQGVATTAWSLAVDTLTGLGHLEGEPVSVFGDGYVVASPNNTADDYPTLTVSSGQITLPAPYAVVHVGLPYTSDVETLDLDTPQGPSLKDKQFNIDRVLLFTEKSRGIFAGREAPDGDDPLEGLQAPKIRDEEGYDDPNALRTESIDVTIETGWDGHGRVFVRQVDPLPLAILSITAYGHLAS